MIQLPLDCPHCGTKRTAMSGRGGAQAGAGLYAMLLTCNTCRMGVMVHIRARPGLKIDTSLHSSTFSAEQFDARYEIMLVAPRPPQPRTVDSLPDNVAATFREAELNFSDKRFASAGVGYRKAIERALKHLHPEAKGMLNARIRALETENALPPSMIALLDSVKLLGNDSVHEEVDPGREDVEAARDFTALLLTYLFELPARVERAKARKDIA